MNKQQQYIQEYIMEIAGLLGELKEKIESLAYEMQDDIDEDEDEE